jgi:hypothetical protein
MIEGSWLKGKKDKQAKGYINPPSLPLLTLDISEPQRPLRHLEQRSANFQGEDREMQKDAPSPPAGGAVGFWGW